MAGESLGLLGIDERGVVGDRWFAVVDHEGYFAAGKDTRRFRRRDSVFTYSAQTGTDGVTVSGPGGTWAVGDPVLSSALSEAMGLQVHVAPEAAVAHQDAGAVSLVGSATLRWCTQRWGIDADPRRLRVNIMVETDEPFVEESWVGQAITAGQAGLRVVDCVQRCRVVDVPQDGASARDRWLRSLAVERQTRLAVYADVEQPGQIVVGEPIGPA